MFDYCFRIFGLKCNLSVLSTFQQVLRLLSTDGHFLITFFPLLPFQSFLLFLQSLLPFSLFNPLYSSFSLYFLFPLFNPIFSSFRLYFRFSRFNPLYSSFSFYFSPFLIFFTPQSFFLFPRPSSSVLTSSFSFFIFFTLQTCHNLPPF